VAAIIDPHIERSNNNSNELKDLRRQTEAMHKSIEEMERVIKHDVNLKAFLPDIKKRQG
jgi:heme oxygenase